jgi:hypothetical protein
MTISSVSSNNYYYDTTSTTLAGARRRFPSDSNPMEKALNSLTSALKSGDISTAQSVLKDVLSHAPKSSSGSTGSGDSASSSSGGGKITEFLKSLQTALTAGDTTKAQSIVSSLKDYMAANPPPKPPGAAADTTNGTSESSNPMEKALDSLASALGSGDISTAQSVLKDILSHAPKSSSDSTGSGDSTSSSSGGDKITDFLKSLQTALTVGDTTKAQSIVSSLKDFMAANPPPQPPGAGRYSTDGDFTSISSASTSALSALA